MRKRIKFAVSFACVALLGMIVFYNSLYRSQVILAAPDDIAVDKSNFCDDAFREYVSKNIDSDGNGVLSSSEIDSVKQIYVPSCGIQDMTGLEYFTSLEVLDCEDNSLFDINTSKNTKLRKLICRGNKINSLDLSKNTELVELDCADNSLTSLDLDMNKALKKLVCCRNHIVNLDLTNNVDLVYLNCSANKIKELSLSKNLSLETLYCYANSYSKLNIAFNPILVEIVELYMPTVTSFPEGDAMVYKADDTLLVAFDKDADLIYSVGINSENFPDANFRNYVSTTFDKDSNGVLTSFEMLDVESIIVSTKSISDLSGIEFFPNLIELDCSQNALVSLDLSRNPSLEKLRCYANHLASVDVSKCPRLKYFNCFSNELNSLNVSYNPNLEVLLCDKNKLSEVDIAACHNLTKLVSEYPFTISGSTQKSSHDYSGVKFEIVVDSDVAIDVVGGIPITKEYFPDKEFRFEVQKRDSNNDEILDSNEIKAIINFNVANCDIEDLEGVQYLTSLKDLACFGNRLSKLDLSKNTELTKLVCGSNNLTSLDLSHNTSLEYLYCSSNQLTSLDVSKNTVLSSLLCFSNNLTNLDVSKNTNLVELKCYENPISSLDVSKNTSLEELYCGSNQLKELDLSKNTELRILSCSDNQISKLDLANNKKLESLFCYENQLESIQFPKDSSLWRLICYSNKFTDLDFSECKQLRKLTCYKNNFSELNIYPCLCLVDVVQTTKEGTGKIGDDFEYLYHSDSVYYLAYDKSVSLVIDEPKYYTISFDANGGSGTMTALTEKEGTLIVLPENEFTAPAGKVFDKWDAGLPGEKITVNSDMTIKALWKEVEPTPTTVPTIPPTPTTKPDDPTPTTKPDDPTPTTKPGDPTPTTKPGDPTPTTKPEDPTPTPSVEKEPSIADFVERLYTIALNRESEKAGKDFWINEIESGNRTGGDCAHFFLIEAEEFLNRGLSREDFVETLYKTFFDRDSEAEGKAFWVGKLKSGEMSKEDVINGFIDSKEWCNVCATYGVKSGAPNAKAEFASKNAKDFATRLYTCCLNREPESEGLKYWSLALTNLEQTGCSAAKFFFTGDEFVGFKLKNDEFVRRLYTTFMGRDPEASEVAYWVGEIDKGTQTKDSVLQFFGSSEEFTNICKTYGIDRGEI